MSVTLAKTAGYCIGVKLAVDGVYNNLSSLSQVTFGPIIHNKHVTGYLASKGVTSITTEDELNHLDKDKTVVIRAHGVHPNVYELMNKNNIGYKDYTCPYVKKIHRIVQKHVDQGDKIIILGEHTHPEIIGINGHAGDTGIIIKTPDEAKNLTFSCNNFYVIVVQTTFISQVFNEIVEIIKNNTQNVQIYNTICGATIERQEEAEELSKKVDKMIIIGDKTSSNSNKLVEISQKNCKDTYFVESISEICLNNFSKNDKIGITAGASTPTAVIKEGVTTMSNLENQDQTFEQLLEGSFSKSLHTGDVVKGEIIQVSGNEVSVNLNYKSDGVIHRNELTDDQSLDLKTAYKIGDMIEAVVLRVNDGEGNVSLSHKRIEEQKHLSSLQEAFENKTVVSGKVVDIIKGGMMARIHGVKVFVPSSQAASRFVEDLSQFKGKELNFHIIECNQEKRRILAGRKELAAKEEREAKEAALAKLEEGMEVTGTVSRMVGFGVFVDLGDIDGLIHISEISWNRNKKPSNLFEIGDQIKVKILKIDREKLKLSLSVKELQGDPWAEAANKFPVGTITKGSVVRMVKFGAFVELDNGVDGLIHISQISQKHVVKAEDVLKIGQVVDVKIMEIDLESKRISLSKKEADLELGNVEPEIVSEEEVQA